MANIPNPVSITSNDWDAKNRNVLKALELITNECIEALNKNYSNPEYAYVSLLITLQKYKNELCFFESEVVQAIQMLISNLNKAGWHVVCKQIGSKTPGYMLVIRDQNQANWHKQILVNFV